MSADETLFDRLRQRGQRCALPALLFIGAAAAGLTPNADGDIYWHLAAGREMVRRHALLYSDPFSVSAQGRPWVDVHWLFQLGAYAVHSAGGLWALLAVKCALIGVSALLFYAALERRARPLFALGYLAALFATRHLLSMRPVIVSLVLLACFFMLLERFRRSGRSALLLPLPLLQVVWCNCQGLSALGPAVVGAYALATTAQLWMQRWFAFSPEVAPGGSPRSNARALLLLLAACILASLVTPYGLSGFALPASLFDRLLPSADNPYAQVAENVPPFALDTTTATQFWHLKWFIAVLVLAYGLARRVRLSQLLLVLGFGSLALLGNRNVLLFYAMATPVAAALLAPAGRRLSLRLSRYQPQQTARILSRIALVGLLALMTVAATREPALGRPAPFRFPVASARQLAEYPGQGAVFCADQQGGYLIWTLYPRFRPYLDTRLGLRSADQLREYLRLADAPEGFDALAQKHDFAYVVLPIAYPDRYLGLITYLYHHPNWQLIFSDGSEMLFARRDAAVRGGAQNDWNLAHRATTDRLLAMIDATYGADSKLHDAALVQFATLQVAVNEFAQAQRVLARTSSAAGAALRTRALLAAGDLDAAQELGEERAKLERDDVRNLVLLAMIYGRRGRLQPCLHYLRRALAIDPLDAEALGLLATLEEQHAH